MLRKTRACYRNEGGDLYASMRPQRNAAENTARIEVAVIIAVLQ